MSKCNGCICNECKHKSDCNYDHCNDGCEQRKECEKQDYDWINQNEE